MLGNDGQLHHVDDIVMESESMLYNVLSNAATLHILDFYMLLYMC